MRLTNIEITNFQGIRHAALPIAAPLLLVSGPNGAGKSSLLDAISLALTGQPRRVSLKKDISQLIADGAKKGEVSLSWLNADSEELSATTALPSGKGNPLADQPFLPFVLDAAKFAGLDAKDRRKVLFELTGASASPAEITKRLIERGADAALVEHIKPLLRAGFQAAADEAKERASQVRGAWKEITGETYGSQKAEGWKPDTAAIQVNQDDLDAAIKAHADIDADLAEALKTLGAHKSAHAQGKHRQQRMDELAETAGLLQRRQNKLNNDKTDLENWKKQVASAEAAAGHQHGLLHDLAANLADWIEISKTSQGYATNDGKLITPWFTSPVADRADLLLEQYTAEHGPIAAGDLADNPEHAKRLPEYRSYVENLTRAVANSERDLRAAEDAATQLQALQTEAAALPSESALANAEQHINDLRQQRDQARAKAEFLQEQCQANAVRDTATEKAAKHHTDVQAWTLIAEALAPDGIPAEILSGALEPVNTLLTIQSAAAKWNQVQITAGIEITYGGRLYGLLSESEKWRCDALLAVAIARLCWAAHRHA
ncbi:AAA family ATPase [Azomonas macrocytogenes]|uniref:Energy-coupling factor transporter ATP-binding protein EcfA2 n=1 Tax=Azomonas macrocytogenes TaxID=69962 RepID=A0A839T4Q9_AZOMA|nr:AAA family ATPase [Azomonas macrocytogenes]MBB3103740.1 energy-coupling factor transporter ATP-binding protein EcfA2 [Azomonas macrocytogenes]